MTTTLIFDLETNGLLYDLTRIHCLVIYDYEADQTLVYNDEGNKEPIVRGISRLEEAECIVGHNIIGYDIPAIQKLYSWFEPPGVVMDTLLLSRLYHADLLTVDKKRNWKHMPLQMYGGTALKPTAIGLASTKDHSPRLLIGRNGLKKWRTTVSKMLLLPKNYANTSTPT
jgi:uncharacterized protein YprB with RNaseH-like and TPR domain